MKLQMRPISELKPSELRVIVLHDADSYPVGMSAASAHQLGKIAGGLKYWAPMPEIELPIPPAPTPPKTEGNSPEQSPKLLTHFPDDLQEAPVLSRLPNMFELVHVHIHGGILPAMIYHCDLQGYADLVIIDYRPFVGGVRKEHANYGTELGQWSYPEEAACPAQPEV